MYHKILNLAFATVGFAALASCSSDDGVSKKDSTDGSQFMAISIRSIEATPGLKAPVDGYESGTEEESKLGTVRFYFFNADGSAFMLSNARRNSRDITFTDDAQHTTDGTGTVERQGDAVLVVDGVNGARPASIVAVANPSAIRNSAGGSVLSPTMTLDQLKGHITTAAFDEPTGSGLHHNFAMTNSVYLDNGVEQFEVSTVGKVKTSPEDARRDPVDIYVERIAAKVTVNKGTAITGDATEVGQWTTLDGVEGDACLVAKDLQYGTGDDKTDIYAVVKGWGLADEQPNAYVKKNIEGNASWSNSSSNDYLNFTWSTADYHRSFWETRPVQESLESIVNHPWSSFTQRLSDNAAKYTMPNTIPNNQTQRSMNDVNRRTASSLPVATKVLVAAQLYYKNADGAYVPAEVCYDLSDGANYIGEVNLINAILNRYKNKEGGLIKVTTVTDAETGAVTSTTAENLDVNDLEFITTGVDYKDYEVEANIKTPTPAANTTVRYARLNGNEAPNAEEQNYTLLGTDDATSLTAANSIINTNKASIYKSGDTYYFTAIQHLGATGVPAGADANTLRTWYSTPRPLGWFGVVRNHWYQVTINSLSGLGTAVYFPEKDIVPVIPQNNNSYLAARINVLQWRVVPQAVDINAEPGSTPVAP